MSKTKALSAALIAGTLIITGCQHLTNTDEAQQTNIKDDAKAMSDIEYSNLSRYTWRLVNATDNESQSLDALDSLSDKVSLGFSREQNTNTIWFNVGCNSMSGGYTLNENVLDVSTVMSTQMICDDKTDAAERLLAKLMQGSSQLSYKKDDMPILTQITENGYTLVWQGSQTPEARYSQQGETVFWRIDHAEQPCPDGTTKSCLNIKPVHYDEKGIKQSEGEWEIFVGEIEGYTHDSEHDTIVRLKRFTVDPADVKGKQFVYVFDTVVESAVVEDK